MSPHLNTLYTCGGATYYELQGPYGVCVYVPFHMWDDCIKQSLRASLNHFLCSLTRVHYIPVGEPLTTNFKALMVCLCRWSLIK